MDYIGRSPIMESCPAVLTAYLGVLTSLAADHRGAEAVHGQLAHSGAMYATLSWARLFEIMKTYCLRYSQDGSKVSKSRSWLAKIDHIKGNDAKHRFLQVLCINGLMTDVSHGSKIV